MTKRVVVSAAMIATLLMGTFAFAGKSGSSGGNYGANTGSQKQKGQSQKDKNDPATTGTDLNSRLQQLNLTADQKAKVKSLLKDESAQLKAVKKDHSLSKDDKNAKTKEIQDNTLKQARSLLTPDQLAKFDQAPPKAQSTQSKGGKKGGNKKGSEGGMTAAE